MDCSSVSKFKKRWMWGLLTFTLFPLIIGILSGLLGVAGLISEETQYAIEFVGGWYGMYFMGIGGIGLLMSNIYFSAHERRCGIRPKFSLLNVLVGVIVLGALVITALVFSGWVI